LNAVADKQTAGSQVTPESPDLYAFSRNPGHPTTAIFIAGKKIPPWFQQFTSEKGCPLGFR